MTKIKVAIIGYGNIGKYALDAILASKDMECVGVVRRNGAENAPAELAGIPIVKNIKELKGVQVAILATPTRKVEEYAKECLALGINTVDSFDIHTQIVDLRRSLDAVAKANNVSSMTGRIEAAFPVEVMTYVEQNYRTIGDKQHRAIAGLSLGGLHTLYISANNPQLFDYVGLFSPQTTNALNDKKITGIKSLTKGIKTLAGQVPVVGNKWESKLGRKFEKYDDIVVYDSLDQKLATQFAIAPKLYYIAVGKEDYVMKLVTMHRQRLDAGGYQYIYNETDGGHTWDVWRRHLLDFLPRLF